MSTLKLNFKRGKGRFGKLCYSTDSGIELCTYTLKELFDFPEGSDITITVSTREHEESYRIIQGCYYDPREDYTIFYANEEQSDWLALTNRANDTLKGFFKKTEAKSLYVSLDYEVEEPCHSI